MFEVCNGLDSCTTETTAGTGNWLGDEFGDLFTVVDTPGFGDSEGNDNEYIEEMMDVLSNELGYTNTILLVIEGSKPRFDNSLYAMLRQMSSIFGETWWEFMMVAVRFKSKLLNILEMFHNLLSVNGVTNKVP